MDSTGPTELEDAIARLGIESGERAVASLALVLLGGRWRLAAGSLIFGPTTMCDQSWLAWHEAETGNSLPVGVYGIVPDDWATFELDHANWRLRRFALAAPDAIKLLQRWAETGVITDGAGIGEHVHTTLGAPAAPRLVLSHRAGSMGTLSVFAERPLSGWLHAEVKVDSPVPIPTGCHCWTWSSTSRRVTPTAICSPLDDFD